MISEIENQLSAKEKEILVLYKRPENSGVKKQTTISILYIVATGIFTAIGFVYNNLFYSLIVFLTFALFLMLRIRAAKKIEGVMPGIIEKYENAIKELKK